MQLDELDNKEPIHSPEPEPNAESQPGDVIVISQSTFYYFLTGLLFFIAGFAVAWVTFATRNDDIKNAASSAAQQAVQTAIAEAVSGSTGPTPTPIPRQDIKFDKDSPAWGSPNAKITIVEFSDFQCPYCEQFYQNAYPLIKKNYGDKVRFVFQNYPLDIHQDALPAANAAACAAEQGKFWEYHDYLFSHQTDLSHDTLIKNAQTVNMPNIKQFTDCFNANKYDEKIKSEIDAGSAYSVGGTPTFFINGTYLAGAQPYSTFKKVIDSELELVGG